VPYSTLIVPFIVSGVGMGLFFAPVANVVLSSVRPQEGARRQARTTRSARSAACSGWRRRVTQRQSVPEFVREGAEPVCATVDR
jgi:hypothetical protein